jgi:hypothetical protein
MAENNNNNNTLGNLRSTLFETLDQLKKGDEKMPIDRAKAIVEVSDAIINTAKVELQFLKDVGGDRFPDLIKPEEARHFLEQENDPRINPHARKGLGTGKYLGS